MSGIFAIFNLDGQPVEPDQLRKMADVAAYRGPDGINYWHEGSFGLAHLALHTTPESLSEIQPLLSPDGKFVIATDARIDNRDELIEILSRNDITISKQSPDNELILAAYRFWQDDFPKYILGDFTFIIYDRLRQSLFCGRDALGVKPLFYSQAGNKLILATEAAQILVHPEVSRSLDEVTIGNFLLGLWDAPARTMYLEIKALLPAHTLSASDGSLKLNRYWQIDLNHEIRYRKEQDYADHFREILTRSIQDRLRVQTKSVGILLSGGLDSTSIAAIIEHQRKAGADLPNLNPISYYFDQVPQSDERKFTRLMQDELGLDIDYVLADDFWLLRNLEDFKPRPDSPLIGAEGLYNHLMSRFRNRGLKVYLTGQGGDHFTQGSAHIYTDRFRRLDLRVFRELSLHSRFWRVPYNRLVYQYLVRPFIPDPIRNVYRRMRGKTDPLPFPAWINADFLERYNRLKKESDPDSARVIHSYVRSMMVKALESVSPITTHQDHVSARNGMEARHPYFDRRLVEYVLAVPPGQHYRAGLNKSLLRKSLIGILPEEIRSRRGKTLGDPFFHFSLREKEPHRVQGLFKSQILSIMGIVDSDELDHALALYFSPTRWDHPSDDWIGTNPWQVISLELWFRWYYSEYKSSSLS